MYCKHCGNQLIDGARFCSNCCAPIDYKYETGGMNSDSYTPLQMTPLNSNVRYVKVKKKHTIRNIFFILLGLIIISSFNFNSFVNDYLYTDCIVVEDNAGNLYDNGYLSKLTVSNITGAYYQGYTLPEGWYSVYGEPKSFAMFSTFISSNDVKYKKNEGWGNITCGDEVGHMQNIGCFGESGYYCYEDGDDPSVRRKEVFIPKYNFILLFENTKIYFTPLNK